VAAAKARRRRAFRKRLDQCRPVGKTGCAGNEFLGFSDTESFGRAAGLTHFVQQPPDQRAEIVDAGIAAVMRVDARHCRGVARRVGVHHVVRTRSNFSLLDSITVYVKITVMKDRLTLDELATQVQTLLDERGLLEAQADGRISAAPDPRTVRYYTTLGLLDRPEIVAREARYGRRHVLQLCAIKAMQAAGMPLAEVLSVLYGRSNPELEALIASTGASRQSRAPAIRALTWREFTVEPGLKIIVEQGWTQRMTTAALEERIRAVLAALKTEVHHD
jgi:DNA-binding transcriptional MerR regulator